MGIGNRIRELRKLKDLTQADFAKEIGLKASAIGLYESGNRNVTDRNIDLICEKYDVNELWLRTGKGVMFKEYDRDESIVAWAAKVARDDYDNAFVKKFAAMMSSLTEKEWELVEAKARFLFDLKKD